MPLTLWKNPSVSDRRRGQLLNSRVIQWRAEYQRIYKERRCTSDVEGMKSFMASIKLSDHMTRELLGQIFGKRLGYPNEDSLRLRSRYQKDYVSDLIGLAQQGSDSVSLPKKKHQDPKTLDIEWVWFNAAKVEDTEEHVVKNAHYQNTMKERDTKRINNAKKDVRTRKRVLKEEEDLYGERGGVFE
jgi:hypothetical protein